MRTLRGHSSDVISCSFSPDGASVISGSGDSTLKMWDAVTGASFPVRFELVLNSSRAKHDLVLLAVPRSYACF